MKALERISLSLLALGVLFTIGCGARHSDKEVYYLVATNVNLPYWQTAAAGFKQAAAQYKVTVKVVGPDTYDPKAELAELHSAIAAKPSGILISVADASVLQSEIDAAVNAGIPVITMDSDSAGSRRLYFIGTNNLEAGRLGGKRVIQKLGGKGNVVFFTLGGQPNTDERLKGFKDVFAARPDIKIVDVFDIKGDARNAFDKAQEDLALTGPKKIDAFVCLGDLALVQTHPPEKCVRFTCQESGAHSFGRLAAIARAQYRPWREAANPASSQRAHGLAPWQRVCESGAPPSSPFRTVSRKYQRLR
jgi:ribose transport system substrate-binding protein